MTEEDRDDLRATAENVVDDAERLKDRAPQAEPWSGA